MQTFIAELWEFISEVFGYWQAYATGGGIMAILGVWERLTGKTLSRRAYINLVIVGFLMVACFLAWRDQYHLAMNQPVISLVDANARIEEVKNSNFNILTLTLEFKNIGQATAEQFNSTYAWALESNLSKLHPDKPQTSVNPINPGDPLTLPLRFSIPVQMVDYDGKKERGMKPERLYIYISTSYLVKSNSRKRCQELWFKYIIGNPKALHQTLDDKQKFEPIIRKAGFNPCPS